MKSSIPLDLIHVITSLLKTTTWNLPSSIKGFFMLYGIIINYKSEVNPSVEPINRA